MVGLGGVLAGRRHRCAASCATAAAGWLVASIASAQVLSIEPDGSVRRYDGPGIYSDTGFEPLKDSRARARTPTPARAVPADPRIAAALREASEQHALSPAVVEAVAWQESRLRPDAISPKGARGLMQLMPGTARALGVDPDDPRQNAQGGAAYLAALLARYDGDLPRALAAYNAGPGAVDRHGGVPPYPETRAYVDAVLERLASAAVP